MVRAVVINKADNVATLIDNGGAGEECELQGDANGKVRLKTDTLYGHKIAIRTIDEKQEIIKYGETIGVANVFIDQGMHVHVHNVDSKRGRGDLVKKV